jgi:activator of 2-hydroxyglutaryl-CoA dehydratase/predicted nucleotide-binding protein (sugar kinase/HSP70/actin superfamily)
MVVDKHRNTEKQSNCYYAGIDIGSSAVHYAVLDGDKKIIYSPAPVMHFANTIGAVKEAWDDITSRFKSSDIKGVAFTGSGAVSFPEVIEDVQYVYDSVAIPLGAGLIQPQAEYIFHIGAKDPYFFHSKEVSGKKIIQEWRTGSKCGGGSGTLIEKQCRRLFEGQVPKPELEELASLHESQHEKAAKANRQKLQACLEEMFRRAEEEAEKSTEPCEFLARCGVVIQSDLIHKQNEGAKRQDNLAGLFRTVARNYKIDVLGSRQLGSDIKGGSAIVTGGVFENDLIKRNLEEFLGIQIDRPKFFKNVAAIGAAAKAMDAGGERRTLTFDAGQMDKVAAHNRKKRRFAGSLSDFVARVNEQNHDKLAESIKPGTEVVLGIDGGSTTTKGALVELHTGKLLDKLYIKTHGNPEESLKRVLRYLSKHKQNVIVKGVGATGSARKLYEKILLSRKKIEQLCKQNIAVVDKVTDEITCHAAGVKHYDPNVDTIFEVGGQDMKFTSFADDGTVKEAKMNYSCQAGSGQTLENMADVISLNVENNLQEEALKAQSVPIIDSTCGVFMEMDENRLIAEGFSKSEIAAAIVRGTAASYYYKFVGGSGHGANKCSAQGGPALGKAFLAALAQVTEKQIEAYPHREIFGAWGQALDVMANIKNLEKQGQKYDTAFRGWELVDMTFEKHKVSCKELFKEKSCGTRDCQLEVFAIESDRIITGGFCPRGNSESSGKPKKDYVELYHRIYEKHFRQYGALLTEAADIDKNKADKPTVGIKRSTATLGEKGIWSAALFSRLGFYPVVSPRTTKEIAQAGVDKSRTEFCIARKLATGHAEILSRSPYVGYLFNPSFIEIKMPRLPHLKYCIYTESEGYVLNDVLSLDKSRQINPILHFGDDMLLVRAFKTEFDRLGFNFTNKQIKEAVKFAYKAEGEFLAALYAEGDKFLQRIETENTKAYVGIGRDYVILDPEASSQSGAMLSQVRGLDYIPQAFLEHKFRDINLSEIVENEFWVESVGILKAGLYVANHPNLFAIRMMNFACGPDSLKIYHEEKIQQAADKPMLVLLTDAQTNNAPFVTRTEAHERVVNQSKPSKIKMEHLRRRATANYANRTWLIPYMGDASFMGAAGLRHYGIDAMVLPTATPRGDVLARKHIHTEVCHPLKGVVGDALGYLYEQIDAKGKQYVEEYYLVMLPTTSGPCRFGKYTELVREFLDREGLEKVPVAGPSSETDYFDIPMPRKLSAIDKIRMQQILFKGIKASDMLEDIFRRFNPYAKDKQQLLKLKQDRLDELVKVVEKGANLADIVGWGRQTVEMFEATDLHKIGRFPLVLYIGEIYMRMHDPYTNNVINMLEDKGLEIVRDPVTDWLDYVNKMNQRNSKIALDMALKNGGFRSLPGLTGGLIKSLLKGSFISKTGAQIAEPFHHILEGRHVLPRPMEIIEALEAKHEFHGNIEGESPLSTGIAYYLMNDLIRPVGDAYITGIFHVGPFTCMQEGVATAKIEAMAQELRKKKPELVFPVVHAFFGDSAGANLDSEIAVFVEQCYQKREMLREKYNPTAQKQAASVPTKIQSIPGKAGSVEALKKTTKKG